MHIRPAAAFPSCFTREGRKLPLWRREFPLNLARVIPKCKSWRRQYHYCATVDQWLEPILALSIYIHLSLIRTSYHVHDNIRVASSYYANDLSGPAKQ